MRFRTEFSKFRKGHLFCSCPLFKGIEPDKPRGPFFIPFPVLALVPLSDLHRCIQKPGKSGAEFVWWVFQHWSHGYLMEGFVLCLRFKQTKRASQDDAWRRSANMQQYRWELTYERASSHKRGVPRASGFAGRLSQMQLDALLGCENWKRLSEGKMSRTFLPLPRTLSLRRMSGLLHWEISEKKTHLTVIEFTPLAWPQPCTYSGSS